MTARCHLSLALRVLVPAACDPRVSSAAAFSRALTAWACVVCASVQSSFAHPFPPSRQRWGVASRCQALRIGIGSLLLLAAAGLDCISRPPRLQADLRQSITRTLSPRPGRDLVLCSATSDISCTPAHTLTETHSELSRRPLHLSTTKALLRQHRRLCQPHPDESHDCEATSFRPQVRPERS